MRTTLSSRPRTTRRLALRPFRRRDVDPLIEAVHASVPELGRWLPWVHTRYGRSDAIRFVRDSAAAWVEGRAFDFTIRDPDRADQHLGNISVWHTSRREQAGEVGYWIRTDETTNGLATEAACRVLQTAFEELYLHRITVRIAVGNRASERVAEKLGFTKEGLLRKEVLVKGEWLDHTLYGMLEEEFKENKQKYSELGWIG